MTQSTYRVSCDDNSEQTPQRYSQDDSIIAYGSYSNFSNSSNVCTKCFHRDSQKIPIHTERIYHQQLTSNSITCYKHLKKHLQTTMLRYIGRCFLFLMFVVLCCVGLLYGGSVPKDKQFNNKNKVVIGGPDKVNMINDLTQSVSLETFRELSKNANNFRDLYRIFLKDKNISDEQLDKMLTTRTFGGIFHKQAREMKEDIDEDWLAEDYDFDTDIKDVAHEAYLHFKAVQDHPLGKCNDPTAELVHVPPEGKKNYFPEYTILHVCRNVSGCCWNPAQECAEKQIEIVSKSFIVYEIQHDELHVPEGDKVEIKFFKNVTRCGCRDLIPLPKCDKDCPHPFTMQRTSPDCVCDCKDDNLHCLEVKYGIRPLNSQNFNCVKSGKCLQPKCDSGEFDMRKGYCPGTDNAKYKLATRDKRAVLSISESRQRLNHERHRNR